MKIVFITTGNIQNLATAKRALGMANPLSKLGWEVFILMEDFPENRERVDLECDEKTKVYYFKSGSLLEERRQKNAYLKYISPDYIYICAFVPRNIVGVGMSCIKIVEHSELQSKIKDFSKKKWLCLLLEYYSIVYSDGLINASKYLQDLYKKRARFFLKGNLPMLYHPYAYNKDVLRIVDREPLRTESTTFVFLGSILRNYGVFTIIDAAEKLSQTNKNFKILMLGKGRQFQEAKDYTHSKNLSDIVIFKGFVSEEDLSYYLSKADAFISPMKNNIQDWARCPSKMYLYLPYKKPIITCKIGEPYEVLKNEGLYYQPEDSNGMSERMKDVLDKKKIFININPQLHTWDYRTQEFCDWIKNNFKYDI